MNANSLRVTCLSVCGVWVIIAPATTRPENMADVGSLMHLAEFARLNQSQVLTFPRGGPDVVPITDCDIESLQPKKFLRDNIIDFYIKWVFLKLKLTLHEQVKI